MATIQFSEGTEKPRAVLSKKQLLPNIIDGMAKARPGALYAEIPNSPTTYALGYRKVTYRNLANAINGIAWMLEKELGKGKNHETLAYIGPNDLVSIFMIIAAVKVGYTLHIFSPRHTVDDNISLFKATDCKTLMTPVSPRLPVVAAISRVYPLRVVNSPSLNGLLDSTYAHYPYSKTFAEAKDEPLLVTHTSGTTSIPKPIIYTHDFAASFMQAMQLEAPEGFGNLASLGQSRRGFVTFPFFQIGNIYVTLFDSIANQSVVITPRAGAVKANEVVIDALDHIQADWMLLDPPLMEELAQDPEMVNFVTSKLQAIAYGGTDISEQCGNIFARSRAKIFNFHGSTETGSFPLIQPVGELHSQDWRYIHPNPSVGLEFRPHEDGLFEAIVVKSSEFAEAQPVFKLFPDLTEYKLRDFFIPHLSKPNLWAWHGRSDDTIVFKPGYNCSPIATEQTVSEHPKVRSAFMTGMGRYQPALLIEPLNSHSPTDSEKRALIDDIYPFVEKANRNNKLGAQIAKTHILFIEPEKAMMRTQKGNIKRARTVDLYKTALDALYEREGDVDTIKLMDQNEVYGLRDKASEAGILP